MSDASPTKTFDARRHHYVPSFWLAGFTANGQSDGVLHVTDYTLKKQWQSTPEGAGHRRDFYRLNDSAPDPLVIEKLFSKLEDWTAPVFKLLDREQRPPTDEELDALIEFMAYQFVRVPSFRPLVYRITDEKVRERLADAVRTPERWTAVLKERGIDPNEPGAEYERSKEFFESKNWEAKPETDWYMDHALKAVPQVLRRLRERYWRTAVSPNGRLIASDNPVLLDGEDKEQIGFRNASLIFFPVTRHLFLTGTREPLPYQPENYHLFAQTNTITLLRSERQVYSHSPEFAWLDWNRQASTEWAKFDREKY